jgi:hypothetical protein
MTVPCTILWGPNDLLLKVDHSLSEPPGVHSLTSPFFPHEMKRDLFSRLHSIQMMQLWDYIVIDFYDFTLGVWIVTLGMGRRVPPLKRTPCRRRALCGIMQRAQKRSQKDMYWEGPTCGLGQQVYEYPTVESAFIFGRARYYCERVRARYARKRSVSVDLSQAQWMTATALGLGIEKRTALTFSKCRLSDIFDAFIGTVILEAANSILIFGFSCLI